MKSNKNIFFSISMILALSTQVYGSDNNENFDDGEIINLTEEDQNAQLEQLNHANLKLIEAAKECNPTGIRKALGEGADIHYQDINGDTADHHVTRSIFSETTNGLEYCTAKWYLLNSGVTESIPNNNGETSKSIKDNKINEIIKASKK